MKKTRSIAGFDSVANVNNNNSVNDNNNANTNNNIIDNILGEQQQPKKMVGIYFDPDIAAVLDQISKKRGDKSAIVNEAVRQLLTGKGLL